MPTNADFTGKRKAIADLLDAGYRPRDIKDLKVSKTTVMKVQRLKKGGDTLETKPREGRPRSVRTKSTIKKAAKMVKKDKRTSFADVSRRLRISRTTGTSLLKEDITT